MCGKNSFVIIIVKKLTYAYIFHSTLDFVEHHSSVNYYMHMYYCIKNISG